MSTKYFFAGFIQGTHWLRHWAQLQHREDTKGEFDSDMSFAGDVGSSFLRIPWMAF